MREIEIRLTVPGASEVALLDGVNAAWAVFDREAVWPWDAAGAAWALEGSELGNEGSSLGDDVLRLRDVWETAAEEAFAAACAGMDTKPAGCDLELMGPISYRNFRP